MKRNTRASKVSLAWFPNMKTAGRKKEEKRMRRRLVSTPRMSSEMIPTTPSKIWEGGGKGEGMER